MRVRLHLCPKTCMLKILIISVNLYLVSCLLWFHFYWWFLYLQIVFLNSNAREHFASPGHIRHFFIVLSLLASAVGSQATITASFSIINQCLALNCFPRAKVIHTSDKIHGQVYIPDVNWLLMILSLTVTIGFHDIAKIGNATGTVPNNIPCFSRRWFKAIKILT